MDGLLEVNLEASSGDVDCDMLCQKRASLHEVLLGDVCRDSSSFEAVSAKIPYVLIWEIQVEEMSDARYFLGLGRSGVSIVTREREASSCLELGRCLVHERSLVHGRNLVRLV